MNAVSTLGGSSHFDKSGYFVISGFDITGVDCIYVSGLHLAFENLRTLGTQINSVAHPNNTKIQISQNSKTLLKMEMRIFSKCNSNSNQNLSYNISLRKQNNIAISHT